MGQDEGRFFGVTTRKIFPCKKGEGMGWEGGGGSLCVCVLEDMDSDGGIVCCSTWLCNRISVDASTRIHSSEYTNRNKH